MLVSLSLCDFRKSQGNVFLCHAEGVLHSKTTEASNLKMLLVYFSKFLESRFYKILKNKKNKQRLETKNRPFSRFAIAKLFQGDEEFVLLMRKLFQGRENKVFRF